HRHGDGTAQTRRERGGGARLPEDHAARQAQSGRRHRYLRRPPHRDVLLACRTRRRSGHDQRPGVRGKDVSRILCGARRNLEMSVPVIAIDGPSASGKGTIASRVAASLGFHYLESGALYRLVALAGGEAPERAAAGMDIQFLGHKIYLNKHDVTDELRSESIGLRASEIARLPAVRTALLTRQRAFRRPPGLV